MGFTDLKGVVDAVGGHLSQISMRSGFVNLSTQKDAGAPRFAEGIGHEAGISRRKSACGESIPVHVFRQLVVPVHEDHERRDPGITVVELQETLQGTPGHLGDEAEGIDQELILGRVIGGIENL